ncbi:TadE/TadG family type IV pilus assembly protein [Yinghuangia seranimata]|uniref:TadE/TadG family type IV pilus assembly protein n=1 Tax=Yinghuangia seranimata TaxID=408067 RepID=UPI00248A9E44|nr:TadE/TadG family type IV pilus assembly protein [Yinghuangia seranimata]MDI2127143.1 TadE/TadG family type IV pilus assembly protein [Yinghuangia seranimata]
MWADQRGAVSVQLVVLVPVVMLILLTIVQFALVQHAHHIAQSAASRALAAARAQNGTAADGDARARAVVAAVGGDVFTHPKVTVTRTAEAVRVEVVGDVIAVVPGASLRVRAVAAGPVDRWTRGGGGP